MPPLRAAQYERLTMVRAASRHRFKQKGLSQFWSLHELRKYCVWPFVIHLQTPFDRQRSASGLFIAQHMDASVLPLPLLHGAKLSSVMRVPLGL
jgi:hypothetical protein